MNSRASAFAAVLALMALMLAVSLVLWSGKRASSGAAELGVRAGSLDELPTAAQEELALPERPVVASNRDSLASEIRDEPQTEAVSEPAPASPPQTPEPVFVEGFGEANGFALEPGTHAGIPGVEVVAVGIDEQGASYGPPYSTLTDFSGFYRFELPVSAEQAARGGAVYHVRLQLPGRLPADCMPTVRVDATTSINSYLAAGDPDEEGLRVTVVDPYGAPLVGVRVLLHTQQPVTLGKSELQLVSIGSGLLYRPRPKAEGRTDLEGCVVFQDLAPRAYELQVLAHGIGFRTHNERVFVAEGGAQEVVVRLEPALRIAGQAIDLSGAACAGVVVVARRVDSSEMGVVHRAKADSEGRFVLGGLSAGKFLVEIDSDVFSPIRVFSRAPAQGLELQLKLRTDPSDAGMHMGEIHGVFVGDRPDLIQVRGVGRAGRVPRESGTQIVEGGEFHLTGLADGVYEVRVRDVEREGWTVAERVAIRDSTVISGLELRVDGGRSER